MNYGAEAQTLPDQCDEVRRFPLPLGGMSELGQGRPIVPLPHMSRFTAK
jgi:hypothetical protein